MKKGTKRSLEVAVRWKEGGGTWEEDAIESEVEDGGEGLAECDEGTAGAYDSTCEDVVPVVD